MTDYEWTDMEKHRDETRVAEGLARANAAPAGEGEKGAGQEALEVHLRHIHETLNHDVPWQDTTRYLSGYIERVLASSPAQRSAAPEGWREWVQEAVAQANHEHFKASGDYVMGRARGKAEALEAVLREIDRRTPPTGEGR